MDLHPLHAQQFLLHLYDKDGRVSWWDRKEAHLIIAGAYHAYLADDPLRYRRCLRHLRSFLRRL